MSSKEEKSVPAVNSKQLPQEEDEVELVKSKNITYLVSALMHEIAVDSRDHSSKETIGLNTLIATLNVIGEIAKNTVHLFSMSAYGDKPEKLEQFKERLFLAEMGRLERLCDIDPLRLYEIMLGNLLIVERQFMELKILNPKELEEIKDHIKAHVEKTFQKDKAKAEKPSS